MWVPPFLRSFPPVATKKKQPAPAAKVPPTLSSPLPGFDTRDTSGRHAVDALLRKHDWRIEYRRKGEQAVWRNYDGRVLPQSEALRTLDPNDVDDAFYAESLFWGWDDHTGEGMK